MTDTNPDKTKPVYKFKTSTPKPATPPPTGTPSPGQERRADQRENQREDRRDDRRDDRREDRRFENRDQDPNHPANRTEARDLNAPATQPIAPEAMLTEQEKDTSSELPGVGPVTPSVAFVPAETIEEQGIGPRTPYPTGNPPGTSETTSRSQAVKGSTDKPGQTPSDVKGPMGTTRRDQPARERTT